MIQRIAECHCGQLKVECKGQPEAHFMCHCKHCQRRTGSAFNLGAWFDEDRTSITGDHKTYKRSGDSGMEITFHFCPDCGTNIFWRGLFRQGELGVATGCFTDPDFPPPDLIGFCESQLKWLPNPQGVPAYETTPG